MAQQNGKRPLTGRGQWETQQDRGTIFPGDQKAEAISFAISSSGIRSSSSIYAYERPNGTFGVRALGAPNGARYHTVAIARDGALTWGDMPVTSQDNEIGIESEQETRCDIPVRHRSKEPSRTYQCS